MAEISKVRFGGVDYDIKSITDITLSEAGTPADAKAVRDRVEGIKGEITDNTGTESLEWTVGVFYQIVNNFVDINTPSSGANWRASVTQASEGDVFYVYTKGGTVNPAWIFIDANGGVLAKASGFLQAGVVITAPANTAYLILNDKLKTNNSYKGVPLKNEIAEEFNSINAMLEKCVYANGTVSNYSNVLDIPNNTITRIPANTTAEAFSGLPNDFYGRAGSIVRLSSYADAEEDGYACFILYELNTEMYFGFSGGSSVTWIKLKNNNGILVASGNIKSTGASITDISAGIYKVVSTLTEDVFAGLPVYGKYGTFVKIIPMIPSTTGTGYEAYVFFTADNVYFGFNTGNSIIWRSMVDIQPKAYQDIDDVICTLGRTTNQIVLMGDSITAGVGGTGFNGSTTPTADPPDMSGGLIVEMNIGKFYRNSRGYCWANELKSYIEEKYPNTTVINNGCSGTHSDQGDTYFDQLVPNGTTILIVSYGINDRGSNNYDTIIHQGNIIKKAQARGIKVILMTPKPVTQDESERIYNSYQVMQKVKTVAVNNNMEPGDMWAEFNKYCFITGTNMSTLMPDGLHPNDAGYTAMFNLTKFILGV